MPKKTVFKGKTHIVAILDRSGSMAHLTADTIGGFNTWLKTTKKAFKGQDATLTLHLFDDHHEFPNIASKLDDVSPLDANVYFARGSTALLDAIGQSLSEVKGQVGKDDRALVLIVTDGHENASREWTNEAIKTLLEKLQAKGNWTIDYMGANQDAFTVGAGLGTQSAATYQPSAAGTTALWSTASARAGGMSVNSGRSMASMTQADYDAALAEEEEPKGAESSE